MNALAELPVFGQVTQLAERHNRELYSRSLVALARRGKVPNVALSHLAVRVLTFLLGQRSGYFAHHKVMAEAVESNLTSVRKALVELRDAGFVSWSLVPPHHPLPTGKYTRTNVNQYFVEAEALLRALGGDEIAGLPRTVASTHPNSGASTGTDPKFEQDPPLPPSGHPKHLLEEQAPVEQVFVSKVREREAREADRSQGGAASRAALTLRRADDIEPVLAAWKGLNLGEPDDRSARALINRLAEGATMGQLRAAVEGAKHDEWLRQGRAKSAFAVVFASFASIERFAAVGREHAREVEAAARRGAAERGAARKPEAPRSVDDARYAEVAVKEILAKLKEISAETPTRGAPGAAT